MSGITLEDHFDDDKDLVNALCSIGHGLTDWEIGFIESISKRIDRGLELSVGQRNKANSIMRRFE